MELLKWISALVALIGVTVCVIFVTRDEKVFAAAEKVRLTRDLQVCLQDPSFCEGVFVKARPNTLWRSFACKERNTEGCVFMISSALGISGGPAIISPPEFRRLLWEEEDDAFVASWEWAVFPDNRKVFFSQTSTAASDWNVTAAQFCRQLITATK